ncbi:MAG TPA: carboxypeptidase-like regulatory domain-containing protein [Bacteroidia bacterium]|nr:carboxypeptidase-like regulatory domain-containing protein [Bacteroidia bacterium]
MIRYLLFFSFAILFSFNSFSQTTYTQTVRGQVVDKVSSVGLPGVVVRLKNDSTKKHVATTDANGNFKIEGIPVGRRAFIVSLIGYNTLPLNDIIVSSGKETFLNIELEESLVQMDEVVVNADEQKDVVTDMQAVNVKTFSIEETERYPGSRQDPARMASNFAGVQGTNDSRNDIVVRGNSPAGLLWRLEEIDIPNPNHFAVAGSAGGPTAIINNKYLANSEFYTGAFPANYGNALGGVFDLKMRNGNNQKHERTFQFGLLGTELSVEGPINKEKGSSYFVNYRYSTLKMLSGLNIKLGTSAVPQYQDGAFRFNFPTKKAGVFSLSGIGGMSTIKIILSTQTERPKELYGDLNRDQYFASNMGVVILNHSYSFNSRTLMKTSLAYSGQGLNVDHYLVLRDKNFKPNDTLPQILGYDFLETKSTLAWYIKHKMNAKNSFKAGFFANAFHVNFYDQVKINSRYDTIAQSILDKPYKTRINSQADFYLLQPYIAFVHKFNEKWSTNVGVFAQYLTLSNSWVAEPRASLRYQFKSNQSLSLAYGMHSQMQPTYLYFATPDSLVRDGKVYSNPGKVQDNKNLGFSRSQHAVLGYDLQISKFFRTKVEAYYQYLWNVPVYAVPSGVSLLNRGASFNRFFPIYTMENKGTGYNYGLEFTLEKTFSKHYFFLYSASLFDSKYTASNGKTFDTDFNGQYMMNLLAGLEYEIGKSKKNSINVSSKFTYGGGKRYSPVDIAASNAVMDVVADNDKVNTLQFNPYNRLDLRIAYKINGKKAAYEIALDLVNLMNTKNVLALSYAPDPANINADPLIKNYQLGFLPLFYVKVDF